jgi:hypothetical protein
MGNSEHCQTFVLRLPNSVKQEAMAVSTEDGISLNHFISLAVVERLTRLDLKRRSMEASGITKLSHPERAALPS